MADSYTYKGGRKTAGSNKPTASKESRTETRINPPAELPKLGKELICPFSGGGWGREDELRGRSWGVAAKTSGLGLDVSAPHFDSPVRLCWPKSPSSESWLLGAGGEGWRWSLPSERRVSGLMRWVSRRPFIVLVAKCYIKGWKGLNEFRPSAASRVAAPGVEACWRTSPRGPSH